MILEEKLVNDLERVAKLYRKQYPRSSSLITKAYYSKHGKHKENKYADTFGTFNEFRNHVFAGKASGKDATTRTDIDVVVNDSGVGETRGYFVTAAIADAELDRDFFESVKLFCKRKRYRLVMIPMRGVLSRNDGYTDEVMAQSDYFVTQYTFNDSMIAMDFIINPQMINPLTGLPRFGQREKNIIIASPKQQLITVPSGDSSFPTTVLSTGAITTPEYRSTRQGRLALQDHVSGGVIVEVDGRKKVHFRHIQADKKGGFYWEDKYYLKDRVSVGHADAFVMGDYHAGFHNEQVVQTWWNVIRVTKPKYIVWHDLLSCESINHHISNNIIARARIPENLSTLEREMTLMGLELLRWRKEFPEIEFVVVKSNHDEWLERYLNMGKYVEDPQNHKLSLELAVVHLDGRDPIEHFVSARFDIPKLRWLKRDEDFKVAGIHLGAHGDKGANGSKGGIRSIELSYGDSVTGHTHTPSILRGAWVVGTTTIMNLNYNSGPSSWMNCSCLVYPSGQRSLVYSTNGEWRLGE